jgi:hypothetical protein
MVLWPVKTLLSRVMAYGFQKITIEEEEGGETSGERWGRYG